ncbi:hypothetical protein F4804DRAFT_317285 [Jackrogersella minutella]|nr:hypothetical protein F4804DRAFT_317285 [Jackrogersella minutella]
MEMGLLAWPRLGCGWDFLWPHTYYYYYYYLFTYLREEPNLLQLLILCCPCLIMWWMYGWPFGMGEEALVVIYVRSKGASYYVESIWRRKG